MCEYVSVCVCVCVGEHASDSAEVARRVNSSTTNNMLGVVVSESPPSPVARRGHVGVVKVNGRVADTGAPPFRQSRYKVLYGASDRSG